VPQNAKITDQAAKTCRFLAWAGPTSKDGSGPVNKPVKLGWSMPSHSKNPPNQTSPELAEKVLQLGRKTISGHHIQMDGKFVTFIGKKGRKIRRFQYTAIDDTPPAFARLRSTKSITKLTDKFCRSHH
jgi:hypothetical protein